MIPPFFAAQIRPEESSLVPCRVSAEFKAYYGLFLPDGSEALGVIRKRMLMHGGRMGLPVVGDWVLAEPRPGEDRLRVTRVLDRQGLILRRESGRAERQQPFAANVDVALVIAGLDTPLNVNRLERFCAVASRGGATPWVLLNKADLHPDYRESLDLLKDALPGVRAVACSAQTGMGMDALDEVLLPGKTLVLLGPSGVGKSTLVNQWLGHLAQDTCDVREGDSKGRHTTTYRRMVKLAGGALLIDSPGVRELGVVDAEGIEESFDDILEAAARCRFRDCRHVNEPGCAVLAAVEAGALDAGRHESYLKLRGEAEGHESRLQQAAWDQKKAAKQLSKTIKRYFKDHGH